MLSLIFDELYPILKKNKQTNKIYWSKQYSKTFNTILRKNNFILYPSASPHYPLVDGEKGEKRREIEAEIEEGEGRGRDRRERRREAGDSS